jgi:CRP-like cAMP-binding protein
MNRIPPDICKSCTGCTSSGKSTCGMAQHYLPAWSPMVRQPAPGCRLFGLRSQIPMAPDSLWQIDTGIVRASTWNEDGSVTTLGFWGPGDLLGYFLPDSKPFLVECLTSVAARSLPSDLWPDCTNMLVRQMQRNYEYLDVIIGCRRVPNSLERLFVWLAKRFGRLTEQGYLIDMRLTHQDLAEAVGSTRVTITRILKELEQQGICHRLARGRYLVTQSALDSQMDTSFSSRIPVRQTAQSSI